MGNFRYAVQFLRQKGYRAITDPAGAFNDFVEGKKFEQNQALLEEMDFSQEDVDNNKKLMDQFNGTTDFKLKSINWFLPTFERAYGGINTILRFAEHFHTQKGIQNTFIICGPQKTAVAAAKEAIAQAYPNLSAENITQLIEGNPDNVPYADISIATYWTSAYKLLKFNKTRGKFYFIQDYEPLFFPAGFTYGLVEATYRFGFHAIINTKGLYSEYQKNHSTPAAYFTPSVDHETFYPQHTETKPDKPFKIFFYGRPNPRNAFELGLLALKKVKRKYGDQVEIYSAGSQWSRKTYDQEGEIENLGVLHYKSTAELYRSCHLGVVFMFTKHPSYLPFELMACGCPVLTNTNSATAWLLKDNVNCALTEPTVSSVSEKIETLMANPDLRKNISLNGLKTIQETNWQDEIEKIYRFICKSRTDGANKV